MLLADRIIRESQIRSCPRYLAHAAPMIAKAQRFVLSESFALAADAMNQKEINKIISFSRVPFQTTWIEVAHQHRPSFVNSDIPLRPTEKPPERIGVLFEASSDELDCFLMSMFFSFHERLRPESPFHVGTTAMSVCFAAKEKVLEGIISKLVSSIGLDPVVALSRPRDRHMSFYPNPHYLVDANNPVFDDESLQDFLLQRSENDWRGEGSFWLATLGLLNCRNAAEVRKIDNIELNKKRRRLGREPLTDHHLCLIRLGKNDVSSVVGEGDDSRIRAHFVRGHFKIRKSGIFWWSPFMRGDLALGFAAKDYSVQSHELH